VIKDILKDAEGRMRAAIQVLNDDLGAIRTGRAMVSAPCAQVNRSYVFYKT